MTKEARLEKWRRLMRRYDLSIADCARLWKISLQVCYNWHNGQGAVPAKRLEQLEARYD